MPLIFAANERSQHEKNYSDDLEVLYEFPAMYRKMVTEGEEFIYYRGTQGTKPAGYFGVGIIGAISESSTEGRLTCEVYDVRFFEDTVPLKDPATKEYLEDVGPNRVNMRRGVRPISDDRAARIVGQGLNVKIEDDTNSSSSGPSKPLALEDEGKSKVAYASKEHAEAIFRYSTDVVLDLLRKRHPEASIVELPKNNPGFDIRINGANYEYVEVKGTTSNEVFFWLSEGERRFAEVHSEAYALFVVFDIDLEAKTHKIEEHLGHLTSDSFTLIPENYRVKKH